MADLISYGDYIKTLPTYGDYIKTMPTIDEYERQREEEERKKREQEILALYERRLKMIEEERKKFMESQPMAQSVADRYGTGSYAYQSLLGQMEDPNSPLNQQYGTMAQIAQERIAAQQAAGTGGISYQRPEAGGGRNYLDELIGTAAEATNPQANRPGPNDYDSSRKSLDDILRIGYQGKRRPAGTGTLPGDAGTLPGTEPAEPDAGVTQPVEEQVRRMMGTPGYTQPGNLPENPGKGNGTEIDFLLTGKAKTANAQTAEGARSNAPRSNAGVIPNAPAASTSPAAAAPTPNAPSTPWGTDADSWMRQRMRTSAAAESPAAAAPTAGTPIGTAPALPWQTGTATDWHDTQGVASWVDQVRSMGTYTGNDPMYMSDKQIQENIEKLKQYKEQILDDKNKTAAEKQAEIDEINAQLQDLEDQIGVYQRLYYSGVPKTSDRSKWGELGEQDYFKTKPENYDTDDAIKQEYDRMLYDAVHGQGAYDQKMQAEQIAGRTEDYYRDETIRNDYDQKLYDSIYGEGAYEEALARIETDEDVDRFDAEMEKLWEEKENSKKTSLAMEDEIGMLWEDLESGGFRGWMDETQKKKNQIQNKMKQRKPTTEEIDRNIQNYQTELDNRAAKSEWEKKAQEKAKQEGLTGEYNPELVEMGQDALSPYAPQIAHGDLMDQIYYSVNHPETGQRNEENDQNGFLGFLDEQTRTELNIYKHMTQKERETFNILYGSGSEEEKEAAQAYLDTFKNKLSNLQYDYRGKRAEEDASGKYGAIAGLQRINTKPAEGFLGMLGTIKTALGDKSAGDKTSEYYIWAERNNKIQNARRQVWDDKLVEWFGEGARGVGGFLNDGFYSLADMFVAKLISGGVTEIANLDKAGKIAGGIMQLVMSSEATAGTMLEKLEQNMNPQEAALYAFGSGIIEAVTEKYSIEKFLHADIRELLGNNKEFVRYVMKNFIAEGSEEVASDVLNLVMDGVVSNIYGHEDELMARYRELEKQYGANKASEMVLKEELEQMGTSFLAGGMSSLVSSLAIGANTRTRMYFENRGEAKTANQYGKVNDVIKAAEGIEGDDKYKKKIADLKKTWDEKGKLTTRETMDLFKTIRETGSNVVESTIQAEATDYSKEQIKAAMEQNGTTADAETIQAASEGAAQLLTGDGELTGKQKKAMQQIPEAMSFVSDMMGEAEKQSTLKERIQKETKSVTDAMNSIRDSTNPYKVRTDVDFGASQATDDDISRAEGTRTNSPLEVIAEGKFGEIVKIETKKVVQDGKTVYQQKAILADRREVDLSDIKGINKTTATVLGFASLDKNRMSSDKFNTTLLQYSKVNPSDTLIKDAMNIRMATLLGKSMPQTNLDQATANALREASQADFDEAEANRVKNNRIVKPGEGKTTFNGVEFGSEGWNKAIKSLSKYDRDQANAIGTLSKVAGFNVTIINDANQDAFFGDESQTGIVINLAGTDIDENGNKRKHHAVVTFGHEVTHLLEHSSQEGYAELRKFILSRLEQRGMNVEQRITNLIDLYGAHGVDLDLNGAIAEIVANGCDQVLGDENAIRHLQQTNENLYGKVKGAVMNIVDRIKNAIGMISESQSRESSLLIGDMNEIVKKWTGAYDESLTAAQNATGTEAETDTEVQYSKRDKLTKEDDQIKLQMESHLDEINAMEPVDDVDSSIELETYYKKGAKSKKAAYKLWGYDIASKFGTVERKGLGVVSFSNQAVKKGISYLGTDPLQIAAFKAVPNVIRYGNEINYHENHKDRNGLYSHTFAAPILFDGERHNVGVVVQYSENEHRYKAHKIFLPNNSVLTFNIKEEAGEANHTPDINPKYDTAPASDTRISQQGINDNTQKSVRLEGSDRRQAALDEAKAAQNELNEIRSQYKALNESKEHQDWIERVSNAGFKSKVVDEYKSWLEKTGLDDLSRRMKEAQERVNKANKEYERIYEEEEVAKEQEAIKKSGLTEEDWRRKEAVKEFGYATNFREAGYMLPNGKMLNFSGEKGRHMNRRGQDHRAISTLYANKEGGNAMIAFMKDGNIRVMAETPGIDIIQEPTAEQYNAIRKMAQQFAKEEYFNVDFTDERGNVIDSIEYDGTVNPTRIVNDIKNFFKTGEAKQPSLVSQFHQFSIRENADYMKAVKNGDTETAQRMVDKAAIKTGYRIKAYHGTGRADRVGTVFRADRATSGPMAFFTDSREIAENYSKNKIDTSIAYDEEYGDYYTQFRVKTKNGKNVPVGQLWNTLNFAEKRKITEAAKHITLDDEAEEIIYDNNAKHGIGNFDDYTLHQHKGNAIEALIEGWLEDGTLWEREGDFLKVLEMAGIKGVTWNNPDARYEKVYDTYLKILNPFDTSNMYTNEFLDNLQEWWDQQDQDQYTKESMGADNWDKNSITVDEWIEDARRDVKEGTTHNWTRIPDGVTAYLKDQGYDGIKDQGGKGGGAGHTVWIPFSSEQIKSAEPVTYDNDGNPIPLSERFNPEQEDIRYSIRDVSKLDVGLWMNTVNENSLQTEAEKQLLREYRNLRMRYDLYSKRANDARNKMREIEAVPEDQRTKEQKRMLQNLSIREQNARGVAEQAMQKMNESMEDEGFARLMYQQRQTLENFIYGKTQAEVRDSVEAMERNAQAIQQRITKNQAALDEIQKSGVMQKVKSILGTTTVDQAATDLKKHFNSSWTKTQIRNFLDPILLKMSQGEDFSQDIERLASEMIASDKSRRIEELDPLRGLTITIGPGQMAELKGRNSSLKEIRRRLAGTGIRIQQGEYSSLERDIDDLRQEFPQIPELGNEKDALENFVSWVEGLKDQSGSEFYAEALADAIGVIAKKAASTASGIYLPTDSRARQQVLELVEYIKGLQGVTNEAQRTLTQVAEQMGQMAQAGQAATGRVNMLARDVNVAIDYYNRTAQMAEDTMRKQRTTEIIQQLKSDQAQKMLKVNEEWRNLIERDRNARKQMEVNAQERSKINTNVTRLYKLLNEPKGSKNIPEELQGLARQLVRTFVDNDLGGGLKITKIEKKQLIEAQRKIHEWIKRDGEFYDSDLADMDDAPIQIISNDLATIYEMLDKYNSRINGKNKLDTLQQQGETLQQMSQAVAEIAGYIKSRREITLKKKKVAIENQAYKVMEGTQGRRAKEWTGKIGGLMNSLHRGIISGNMTPEYFFRNLRNAGLNELWDGYHDAENRNGLELKKAQTRIGEIAEKHGYKNWDMKQKVTLDLESGNVQVTLGQLMSLYAIWNREHTLGPEMSQHLEKGGFYAEQDTRDGLIGRQEIQKRAYKVSEEDAAKIANMLTDEQKDFVNDIVGYMSNDMSQLGNEASMAAYGIKMYKESYYFPMQMWDGIKSRKSNEGASAAAAQDRAFHPSFSKSRMHGAQNALVIGDFMQTATDHITGMINYATMGLANENFQKVLNAQMVLNEGEKGSMPNIRTLLEEAYGREAMNYLNELQKQLNGGAVKTSKSLGDKAISLFRKNAVAGSLSVAAQQPLSYIRAAALINPKYLAQGLAQEYWKGSYEERLKHSGVSVIKDMGRFDMNAGQSAREFLMPESKEGKARAAYEKATDMMTILPELMDRWTWNRMWVAVKAEQKDMHPEMDIKSDEFLDMCGERFNELMRRTQVYDSTLVKSQNMRNDNYWVKGLTSFMAEPTVTLNVLADAVRSAKEGEKGGKIYLGKAIGTFLLSAVLQAAVKAGFSTGRTPDDKKTWLENFLYRFGTNMLSEANPATMIPGYNDLVSVIKDGKLEDDAMGAVGKIFKAWDTGRDTISSLLSGESTDWYKGIEDSAGQIAQLFSNIPAKNIMRDMRAMYNWMIAKPYADRATDASVIKYQWEDAKANADWLTTALIDKLGIAGYDARNTAYYERIYQAKKAGNEQLAQNMIDYLLNGKGVKQETIDDKLKSAMRKDESLSAADRAAMMTDEGYDASDFIIQQVKAGNMTAAEARKQMKAADPKDSEDSIWWKVDRAEYKRDTGNDAGSGYYYRLKDAISANNVTEIKTAVKQLMSHGFDKDKIKDKLSDWKSAYLNATGKEKIAIKNALLIAYKEIGILNAETEIINKWKPAK